MSEPDENGWFDIRTAPRDGSQMLWAGKWRPFDILPGGEWTQQIFSWTTVMSDGTGYGWLTEGFSTPERWNVDWLCWQPLPKPPTLPRNDGEGG
jgi:hypothetical protein